VRYSTPATFLFENSYPSSFREHQIKLIHKRPPKTDKMAVDIDGRTGPDDLINTTSSFYEREDDNILTRFSKTTIADVGSDAETTSGAASPTSEIDPMLEVSSMTSASDARSETSSTHTTSTAGDLLDKEARETENVDEPQSPVVSGLLYCHERAARSLINVGEVRMVAQICIMEGPLTDAAHILQVPSEHDA
jgi:hypothetical protein